VRSTRSVFFLLLSRVIVRRGLQGVGLANTLFGLLAAVTFFIILQIVYTNRRRARQSGGGGEDAAAAASTAAAASSASFSHASHKRGESGSSMASAGRFGWLGAGPGGRSSSVSFSSYVKFLNVSSFWAALWVIFNL